MADKNRYISGKKQIIREMADSGTELLTSVVLSLVPLSTHLGDGKEGNVVVGIGGTLMSPPLSVSQVTISGTFKASQQ